jgi:hypothetical protein
VDPHHVDADLGADPDSTGSRIHIFLFGSGCGFGFLFFADVVSTFHPGFQIKSQTLEKLLK